MGLLGNIAHWFATSPERRRAEGRRAIRELSEKDSSQKTVLEYLSRLKPQIKLVDQNAVHIYINFYSFTDLVRTALSIRKEFNLDAHISLAGEKNNYAIRITDFGTLDDSKTPSRSLVNFFKAAVDAKPVFAKVINDSNLPENLKRAIFAPRNADPELAPVH